MLLELELILEFKVLNVKLKESMSETSLLQKGRASQA